MKRDVMQAAGLESFAEIAVIIFFITFAVLVLRTMFKKSDEIDEMGALPLSDGQEVLR